VISLRSSGLSFVMFCTSLQVKVSEKRKKFIPGLVMRNSGWMIFPDLLLLCKINHVSCGTKQKMKQETLRKRTASFHAHGLHCFRGLLRTAKHFKGGPRGPRPIGLRSFRAEARICSSDGYINLVVTMYILNKYAGLFFVISSAGSQQAGHIFTGGRVQHFSLFYIFVLQIIGPHGRTYVNMQHFP
jgi:hypothetical protein